MARYIYASLRSALYYTTVKGDLSSDDDRPMLLAEMTVDR